MIKTHKYAVTFPTNGISLKGSYDFEPGLTAVTGDNGSGKTFGTIEMIRYMLFGKRALRGPASDYKTLDAETVVAIAGEDYTVVRNAKTESLTDSAGEVLAVGTEAVNAKLQKLLGMSLEVFDVVCAAVQKESDRLSKLQPAARRRLIDETVGLNANEAVEKACKDEAKGLLREADALRSVLNTPIEPAMPADYQPASVLGECLEELKTSLAKVRQLKATIAACGIEPVQPGADEPDIVELERHEERRLAVAADVAAATRQLALIPEAEYTAEQLDLAEARLQYRLAVTARGPASAYTLEQIELWEAYFTARDVADHMGDLEVTCPSCDHSFCPGHSGPIAPDGAQPSVNDLRQARVALDKWAAPLGAEPVGLELTSSQIAAGRLALSRADERASLLATTWRPLGDDRSAELAQGRQLQVQWSIYQRDFMSWTVRAEAARQAEVALALLPEVTEQTVTDLNALYVEARIYESKLTAWHTAVAEARLAQADIEDRVRRAEDYKLGAKRLAETRQKFKSHLAPTLSRIASSLISEMTGAVLTSVIVDEDMNITVNGQDIATLSGAGSTVANLALRIALGQVLVKGVLPVFIADEADSDMADARAEYTMECLSNLSEKLKQIIVITHKPVKFTDQIISLQGNDSLSD